MQTLKVDGATYELDYNLPLKEREKLINTILKNHQDYFEKCFEKSRVKIILDIINTFFYQQPAKKEIKNKYKILNRDQLRHRVNKELLSISIDELEENEIPVQKFEYRKEKSKRNIPTYSQSKTHKQATLYIHPEKRINRNIANESNIKEHRWDEQLNYKCVKSKDIKIDVFTDDDKNLPYINKSIPYSWSWCQVDTDGKFEFENVEYKIDVNKEKQYKAKFPEEYADKHLRNQYGMDKVLAIKQEENLYIFDEQINLVKNYTTVN